MNNCFRLFLTASVTLASFACTDFKEEEVSMEFKVEPTTVALKSDQCEFTINVLCSDVWNTSDLPDWMSLDKVSPVKEWDYAWILYFKCSECEFDRTGTFMITDSGGTDCFITVEQRGGRPEAVNLGLSVKWASCNVGASKPQSYGDFFAWGETKPYYKAGYAAIWPYDAHFRIGKTGYNWTSYKWCNGEETSLTKYNTSSEYGVIDNKMVLDMSDDAARANWGGRWRMPTDTEWIELRDNCTWTWTTLNGIHGQLVTSKKTGYTDKSIFLPAAGYLADKGRGIDGPEGYYWSSSLYNYNGKCDPSFASIINFSSSKVGWYGYWRYHGFSIRPVTE